MEESPKKKFKKTTLLEELLNMNVDGISKALTPLLSQEQKEFILENLSELKKDCRRNVYWYKEASKDFFAKWIEKNRCHLQEAEIGIADRPDLLPVIKTIFGDDFKKEHDGYTLISVMTAKKLTTILILGKNRSLFAGKLISKENCITTEEGIPEDVGILNLLGGSHHTIKLIQFLEMSENDHFLSIYPFVEGNRKPKNYQELWLYLDHLFEALEYCHSKHVIHGDVKLENVLFDGNSATLIDFEHATTQDDADATLFGTEQYNSPESRMHNIHSTARDIWCVGIIILLLVYQVNPFYDTEAGEVTSEYIDSFFKSIDFSSSLKPFPFLCKTHSKQFPCNKSCEILQPLLKLILTKSSDQRASAATLKRMIQKTMLPLWK